MNCCLNWEKLTSELILWSSNPYAIEAIQCFVSLMIESRIIRSKRKAEQPSAGPAKKRSKTEAKEEKALQV